MSNPNDRRPAGRAAGHRSRRAFAAIVLWLPMAAQCGVLALTPLTAASGPAPSHGPKVPEGYQIRCWQFGRLLFEENNVALPADAGQHGVKMGGLDRHGRPLYVMETRNATCLIRSSDESRGWPK